jgi:uncharacterized YigZ family protein
MSNARRTDPDAYRAPASSATGTYRDRGSKFVAVVAPVSSTDEAKALVKKRSREHHDATHHCFAWRVRENEALVEFSSDAGEPRGTAGPPILAALTAADIEDVVVVVSRWFGGTKLGTGGLVQAYRAATESAISNANVIMKTRTVSISITHTFEQTGSVAAVLSRYNASRIGESYDERAHVTVELPVSDAPSVKATLDGLKDVSVDNY